MSSTVESIATALDLEFYIGPRRFSHNLYSEPRNAENDLARIGERLFPFDKEGHLSASKLGRLENATRELVLAAIALGVDYEFVPRYDVWLAPGRDTGETVDREAEAGYELFRRQWLRGQGLEGGALSVVDVVGNSMAPTLRDGDWTLVDRSRRQMRHGDVFALAAHPVPLLRRIREESGVWWADSDNDNNRYPPLALSQSDEIIGRVVWWGHTEPP